MNEASDQRLMRWMAAMSVLSIAGAIIWALFATGVIRLPRPSARTSNAETGTLAGSVTMEKNGVRVQPDRVNASLVPASTPVSQARELLNKALETWIDALPLISSHDEDGLKDARQHVAFLKKAIEALPASGFVPTRSFMKTLSDGAYFSDFTLYQLKLSEEHRAAFAEKHPYVMVHSVYYQDRRDEGPGRYTIRGIAPGSYLLQCYGSDERYGSGSWLLDVTVKVGDNSMDLDAKNIESFDPN